jgi:cysteine-rich repeat protein
MALILAAVVLGSPTVRKVNITPSKSGYISSRYTSTNAVGKDKQDMMYYSQYGATASYRSAQYEWFNLSKIRANSTILSAKLYKYHDNQAILRDQNNLMTPQRIDKTHRVTLGKMLEQFSETDTYSSNGRKFKQQLILNKVDSTNNINPFDLVLVYNVTDVIGAYVKGEKNYGFSFLGNYNTGGSASTTYYLRSSTQPPRLIVEYLEPGCGNGIIEKGEQCDDGNNASGDGCSAKCTVEKYTYVIPYVGDIDGAVSENWFYFYKVLLDYLDQNKIYSCVTFFPGTMDDTGFFEYIFKGLYSSKYVELVQKGYLGDDREQMMDQLSESEQRDIIKAGRDYYVARMQHVMNTSTIVLPKTYDQIGGRVTDVTKKVLMDLGYNFYFDVYSVPDIRQLNTSVNFDVTQYGVSFTVNGTGRETVFKTPKMIVDELKAFNTSDSHILKINGNPVIPIWTHQQDFEDKATDNKLDEQKWNIFKETIMLLKNDSSIRFVNPRIVYILRHGGSFNFSEKKDTSCVYAVTAQADSENKLGSLAKYAEGAPDAPIKGCTEWSGYGYSWTPENWNVKATLVLNFDRPMVAKNMTIFGDYDACWDRIWLLNSQNGSQLQILNGPDNSCEFTRAINKFTADTVKVETCGWSWSAVDSVQICGEPVTSQNPKTGASVCTWKDCRKGAVSVSTDDSYSSCMEELDIHGFKGTFFLSNMSGLNSNQWAVFKQAFLNGHELGTHTDGHTCWEVNDSVFIDDLTRNRDYIKNWTGAKDVDLVSHAHPCGFFTDKVKSMLATNWTYLSARGYGANNLEQSAPLDFFNLRSINSHEYPGDEFEPPNYFELVNRVESEGKWANLVFHVECDHDGVINYLPLKEIWVDTVGHVVRYIKLRDSANISNYVASGSQIDFNIQSPFTDEIYAQELSIKVTGDKRPSSITVDDTSVSFSYDANSKSAVFSVKFPVNHKVRIRFD